MPCLLAPFDTSAAFLGGTERRIRLSVALVRRAASSESARWGSQWAGVEGARAYAGVGRSATRGGIGTRLVARRLRRTLGEAYVLLVKYP